MREHTLRQFELETSMRRALERNELILHYQPIVSLPAGRITRTRGAVPLATSARRIAHGGGFIPRRRDGLIGPLWLLDFGRSVPRCVVRQKSIPSVAGW